MFDLSKADQIKQKIKDDGYVVVDDIFNENECNLTIEEVNSIIQKTCPEFDIHDQTTYDKFKGNRYGVINKDPLFTLQIEKNRNNPKLRKLFEILYNTDKLIHNYDRIAFTRPVVLNQNFKTPYVYPGVHLDLDPLLYRESKKVFDQKFNKLAYDRLGDFVHENNINNGYNGPIYQGIINFLDNKYEDGGLQVVPGFHKVFDEWLDKKKFNYIPGDQPRYIFSSSNQIDMKYVHSPERVPMKRGSVAIWDKRLAHGSVPNDSKNIRMIQFIIYRRETDFSEEQLKNRDKIVNIQLKINK